MAAWPSGLRRQIQASTTLFFFFPPPRARPRPPAPARRFPGPSEAIRTRLTFLRRLHRVRGANVSHPPNAITARCQRQILAWWWGHSVLRPPRKDRQETDQLPQKKWSRRSLLPLHSLTHSLTHSPRSSPPPLAPPSPRPPRPAPTAPRPAPRRTARCG